VLDEVRRAARTASLDDTIEHFTKGYDTYVGERGVTLSGGQKQRTAIAQMLIRQPEIMIFDDSLSAVDAETDAKIREALKKRTAGSTVILISHRISTLMHADSILVLDEGRVAAQGTHGELLEMNPIYRRIYQLQMQGAEEMQENSPEERQPEGQQSGNRQDPQENDPEECQPEGQQSGSRQDPQGRETVSGKARTEQNGEEARR
jgi:ABC-type protease/lipase transport system fused ATPase/permease subunit